MDFGQETQVRLVPETLIGITGIYLELLRTHDIAYNPQ